MERSEGTLLGGRVRYAQPVAGYRTGIEPVLLAAAVPARAGDRVLEAGTGAGAGLLCLLARVPGVAGVGIEIDAGMAALARDNAAANGLMLDIRTGDVGGAAGLGPFDHAFANPPWHDPAGTRPSSPRLALAKHGAALARWIGALAGAVTGEGSLTVVLPMRRVDEAAGLLVRAGFGRVVVVPLWVRAGEPAKLAIVQGWRGGVERRITAGLALHRAGQGYTAETEAVLRGGGALDAGLVDLRVAEVP